MHFDKEAIKLTMLGVHGEHYEPSKIKPIGKTIVLKTGEFSGPDHPLGVINLKPIQITDGLLDGNWLLTGYRLNPYKGKGQLDCPLADIQPMRSFPLSFIPPGAVQPTELRQPVFALSKYERNPCPGWLERVHLYSDSEKPFEATSVMYTDLGGKICSVEMFNVALRHSHHGAFQRIWVSLRY